MSVEIATSDGVIETLEGDVRYRAGDALLTGTRGERWPVQRHKFVASYEPVPPTKQGESGTYVKKPIVARALRIQEDFEVKVGWQPDKLRGAPGDWLLQYGPGDYGVVTASIFDQTYDLLD